MLIPVRYCLLCFKRYGIIIFLIFITIFAVLNFYLDKNIFIVYGTAPTLKDDEHTGNEEVLPVRSPVKDSWVPNIPSEAEFKRKWIRDKIDRLSKRIEDPNLSKFAFAKPLENPSYDVHVFYYPWYRSVQFDGEWKHWNHEYIPNWKKEDLKVYPTGVHKPPDDIGSNFYPSLGCYSSRDPEVIDIHMKQIYEAGIGKTLLSFYYHLVEIT